MTTRGIWKRAALTLALTAFALTGFGGRALARTGGPDAGGYTFRDQDSGAVYRYIDIRMSGSVVASGDDVLSPLVTLGAPFTFYGARLTTIRASTNGFLGNMDLVIAPAGVDAYNVGDSYNNCAPPSAPRSWPATDGGGFRIFAYHDDIQGDVRHQFFDAAQAAAAGYPGETAGITVFEWSGRYWPATVNNFDAEVILFHDDMSILVMVGLDNQATATGLFSGTMGIQNSDRSAGLNYLCAVTAPHTCFAGSGCVSPAGPVALTPTGGFEIPTRTAVLYTPPAVCGDRNVGGMEQCDDGNTTAGDCCSPTCRFEVATTVCRASTLACDVAETCTGTSGACPADAFAPTSRSCRAATGLCDAVEFCTGTAAACPADALAAAGSVCRIAAGACDAAETCSGTASTCPMDARAADGTACPDALACNGAERCRAGACAAGTALACDDSNVCTADACAEPGGCANTPIAGCCTTDAACDDGNPCTTDTCSASTCTNVANSSCVDSGTVDVDAGTVDTDAGVVDTDAGVVDTDAGVVDTDAGAVDTDAGVVDTDAGTPAIDSGVRSDAGTDAGTPAGDGGGTSDAGMNPGVDAGGSVTMPASCACRAASRSTDGAGALALGLGLALAIARRRRR